MAWGDTEQVGPIGPGTAHARMQATWRRMQKHEALLRRLTGYDSFSSTYPLEVAFIDAFEKLLEECRRLEQQAHPAFLADTSILHSAVFCTRCGQTLEVAEAHTDPHGPNSGGPCYGPYQWIPPGIPLNMIVQQGEPQE